MIKMIWIQQNKNYCYFSIPHKQPQQQVRTNDHKLKNELIEIKKRELQRQHELDVLLDKHQQLLKSEAQNPNNYQKKSMRNWIRSEEKQIHQSRKSIVPKYPFTGHLLARGVSRMIQFHSEKLTELLIDDLLFEIVDIVDTLELKKVEEERQRYEQMALCDYIEAAKDIALRQEEKNKYITQDKQYYPKNLEQFDLITKTIMEEMIWEREAALYQSSDEMAEQIFIHEFK